MVKRTPAIGRFWAKVDRSGGEGSCWLWTAGSAHFGHGLFKNEFGKTVLAHRWAWEFFNGVIPCGICVLHRCDAPPCVNLSHLFLGTQADNMADMVAKGRQAGNGGSGTHAAQKDPSWMLSIRGDAHWTRRHPENVLRGDQHGSRTRPEARPRGEGHRSSKLTEPIVVQIRALAGTGKSWAEIGRMFNVDETTVRSAAIGKTWAHITQVGVEIGIERTDG